MRQSGLYIHIPFCDHKCVYCDFYSITNTAQTEEYISALIREIEHFSPLYKSDHRFDSIFFGGGTPSYIAPMYIERIIRALKENYVVTSDAEITLETNPGTVDKDKLKEFLSIGINRISIGIQSFDDDDLRFLTRIHDSRLAKDTVALAHESGFNNINIDLIFNLPGQTKEKWQKNLEIALQLPIQHISAYSLILEEGTPLFGLVEKGKIHLQGDDDDAELYATTIDTFIKYGFTQYEVSNFCKPGFECIHNNHYWRYDDYLSFGTSSHSFVNGKRWNNHRTLLKYLKAIQEKDNAVENEETPDARQVFDEYVMLALRSKGIDKKDFQNRFSDSWLREKSGLMQKLMQSGYLVDQGAFIKCTPDGYAVADNIIGQLLA